MLFVPSALTGIHDFLSDIGWRPADRLLGYLRENQRVHVEIDLKELVMVKTEQCQVLLAR